MFTNLICINLFFIFNFPNNCIESYRIIKADPQLEIIHGEIASLHGTEPNNNVHLEPYQVAINRSSGGFCGGSLISRHFVLTAAHCIKNTASVQLVLGAYNLRKNEQSQEKLSSSVLIVHENYDELTITNDIGLIKLPHRITLNEDIQTIPLSLKDHLSHKIGLLSGWGKTSPLKNAISPILMNVNLTIIDNNKCQKYFHNKIRKSMLCTSGKYEKGSCNGDSGGPLVVEGHLVGIVSFGTKKCNSGYPSVYTRVSSYLKWIASHTDLQYYQRIKKDNN